MQCNELRLQTHLPSPRDEAHPVAALANLVRIYAQQIDDRRAQLEHDLAYYESKLAELAQIDPLDFTGLRRIYCNHADRTRNLLAAASG